MAKNETFRGYRRVLADLFQAWNNLALVASIFLIYFFLSWGVGVWLSAGSNEVHNWAAWHAARLITDYNIWFPAETVSYYSEPGQKGKVAISSYQSVAALNDSRALVAKYSLWLLPVALLISALLTYITSRLLAGYFTSKSLDGDHIRGGKLVDDETLARAIKKQGDDSDFLLGNLPYPSSLLSRHLAVSGDTGTGKSQLLFSMVSTIRKRGEKAFIVDKSGEFIQHFYNPDTDIILSPFDSRSVGWTPFVEGGEVFDLERLAKSFIPTGDGGGKDDHWPEASVTVLTWLLYRMMEMGDELSIDQLLEKLTSSERKVIVDELGKKRIVKVRGVDELLKGTLAELVMDPDSPEHAASVMASLVPKVRSLYYLRGLEDKPLFSLKDWVNDDNNTGWVFIRITEDQLDSVNPLVTAWIDTVIKSILSLPKSGDRVVWALIDELQSFQKINSLMKAAFEGRKHGLRLMLGFTSVNQLFTTYGADSVKAVLSMLSTKLVFRTSEPDASEWNARLLGESEVMAERQGMSWGTNDNFSASDDRQKQLLVMPTEIQQLADLTAYVRFSGDWPTTITKFTYTAWPDVAAPFMPRKIPAPVVKKILPQADEPVGTETDDENLL